MICYLAQWLHPNNSCSQFEKRGRQAVWTDLRCGLEESKKFEKFFWRKWVRLLGKQMLHKDGRMSEDGWMNAHSESRHPHCESATERIVRTEGWYHARVLLSVVSKKWSATDELKHFTKTEWCFTIAQSWSLQAVPSSRLRDLGKGEALPPFYRRQFRWNGISGKIHYLYE